MGNGYLLKDASIGTRFYRAKLSQAEGMAPIATVLENSFDSAFWSYGSPGSFLLTFQAGLDRNRFHCDVTLGYFNLPSGPYFYLTQLLTSRGDPCIFNLQTFNSAGVLTDGLLTATSLPVITYVR